MFTPSLPASVVTSASTPGTVGHRDAQLDERALDRGAARGRLRRAERARSSTRSSASRVAGRDVAPHDRERAEVVVERGDDRVAVRDADVGPDARVTRRDAGHVAEATGREPQQDRVLLAGVGGDVHERRRRELGHVAHHGDERVVVLGRDLDDLRAQLRHEAPHRGVRAGVGPRRSA